MSLSVQTLHSLHGFFWVKSLNVTPTPQTEGGGGGGGGGCSFLRKITFLSHFHSDVNSKVQKIMLKLSHLMSCLKFCVDLLPQSPSALNTAPSSQEQCMRQTCCLYTCAHEVFWETEKHHWSLLDPFTLTAQGLMEDPLSGLQFAINICFLHGWVSRFILILWTPYCRDLVVADGLWSSDPELSGLLRVQVGQKNALTDIEDCWEKD